MIYVVFMNLVILMKFILIKFALNIMIKLLGLIGLFICLNDCECCIIHTYVSYNYSSL